MMQTDAGTLSFGPYLKAIREQQNIPLSAVASEIRVGLWQLTLIEGEAHDQLPDTVYVKGILKAYAACVGVDTDDILERYTINRRAYENTLVCGNKKAGLSGNKIVRIIAVVCLLLAGAALSALVFYISPFSTGSTGHPGATPDLPASDLSMNGTDTAPNTVTQNPAEKTDFPAVTPLAGTAKPVAQTTRLDLCMDALSDTTINIQIDGISNKKLYLSSKDHVELEAASSFNILISDSAAVDLTLNGKPVLFERVHGRFINLVLTDKGLKTDG